MSEGWIKLHRKLNDSAIMKKPPMYAKVWMWILLNAFHTASGGIQRGQLKTSIPEIQEAMSYYVGYRKETPSKKEIFGILEWLRNPTESETGRNLRNPYEGSTKVTENVPMIVTTKVTHGLLISVVNYEVYQDVLHHEGNRESNGEELTKVLRRERQGNNINKNVKNIENEKKDIYSSDVYDILTFWNETTNSKSRGTDNQLKRIKNAIKNHGEEKVKEAISNYILVKKHLEYYQHVWTLEDFMKQTNGIPHFIDDGKMIVNCRTKMQEKENNVIQLPNKEEEEKRERVRRTLEAARRGEI